MSAVGRVFVQSVEVEAHNVSIAVDRPELIPGYWTARGIVLGTGDPVTWSQRTMGGAMPVVGSTVELMLEPDTWRVA